MGQGSGRDIQHCAPSCLRQCGERVGVGENRQMKAKATIVGVLDRSSQGVTRPFMCRGDDGDFVSENIRRILTRVETDFDRDWGCVS